MFVAFRGGDEAYRHFHSRLKAFLLVLAVASVLSFVAWSGVGTHVGGDDPIVGGGDVVTDYEPTAAQRNKSATVIFLITFLPALVGLSKKD